MPRIGIIGSGPTAIYTLHALLGSSAPLHVIIFEKTGSAGTGMPYRHETNHEALLANIASIELPPLLETLVEWLQSLSEIGLDSLGLTQEDLTERAFFPRVVLGTYFRDQLFKLVEKASSLGHQVEVKTHHQVDDVQIADGCITITGLCDEGAFASEVNHVVVATGHTVDGGSADDDQTYLDSPYPTSRLQGRSPGRIGIIGTSLSGIDATIAVAMDHGDFVESSEGILFRCRPGSEAMRITMMSRNGLLPEADFFCPIPYEPLDGFTEAALNAVIAEGSGGLLDRAMSLFKLQLEASDPEWSRAIGLARTDADTFPEAYFTPRLDADPFAWARSNLIEVMSNRAAGITVAWRYAILRMHEVMEAAVSHFDANDRQRFDRGMKRVFVDNYAAIPPQSVQRLLALHDAGVLDIVRLGDDYQLVSSGQSRHVKTTETVHAFDLVINATGEGAIKDEDVPFKGLRDTLLQPINNVEMDALPNGGRRVGSLSGPVADDIYMASLPYLMADRPFIQGLVSSHELGSEIAADIIGKISQKQRIDVSMDDLLMSVSDVRPGSQQNAILNPNRPVECVFEEVA